MLGCSSLVGVCRSMGQCSMQVTALLSAQKRLSKSSLWIALKSFCSMLLDDQSPSIGSSSVWEEPKKLEPIKKIITAGKFNTRKLHRVYDLMRRNICQSHVNIWRG